MPLYRKIAATIRRQIVAGVLPPGAILPSESFMAAQFDAGRDTVRAALALLHSEGRIDRTSGRRWRVRVPCGRVALTLQPGEEVKARMPTLEESVRLRLQIGEPVLEIRHNGKMQCYAASRTKVRGASPDDWAHPDLAR